MLHIRHKGPGNLSFSGYRSWPYLRLGILIAVFAVYGYGLHAAGLFSGGLSGQWMLVLFPLFLIPYLLPIWRGLKRRDAFEFDAASHTVRRAGQILTEFDDIHSVQIQATNAGCEELRLSLLMLDGTRLELYEGAARAQALVLARELSALLRVELHLQDGTAGGAPGRMQQAITRIIRHD